MTQTKDKEVRPRMSQDDYDLFKLLKSRMNEYEFKSEPAEALPPLPSKRHSISSSQTTFTEPGTYLLMGCVHAPAHNVAMLNGITELLTDIKVKGLVLMGDFLDLNSLSSHDTGKFTAIPGLTLEQEYEAGEQLLSQLLKPLRKDVTKIFIYGNHEHRFNRYMADMESSKRPLPSPAEALKLKEKDFHFYTNWQDDKVVLGKHLDVFHGQYYNVHCAKKTIDVYRGSCAFVHSHRIQTYIEGTTGGFNIGWCGDVKSPFFNYAARGTKSMWQNGFALVEIDEEGNYYLTQIICHNNKFYYGGKKYN